MKRIAENGFDEEEVEACNVASAGGGSNSVGRCRSGVVAKTMFPK